MQNNLTNQSVDTSAVPQGFIICSHNIDNFYIWLDTPGIATFDDTAIMVYLKCHNCSPSFAIKQTLIQEMVRKIIILLLENWPHIKQISTQHTHELW